MPYFQRCATVYTGYDVVCNHPGTFPIICVPHINHIVAFDAIWAGLMLLSNFIDSVRGKGEL